MWSVAGPGDAGGIMRLGVPADCGDGAGDAGGIVHPRVPGDCGNGAGGGSTNIVGGTEEGRSGVATGSRKVERIGRS